MISTRNSDNSRTVIMFCRYSGRNVITTRTFPQKLLDALNSNNDPWASFISSYFHSTFAGRENKLFID